MTIQKIRKYLDIVGLDKLKGIISKSENEKREYGFRFCKFLRQLKEHGIPLKTPSGETRHIDEMLKGLDRNKHFQTITVQ